MVAVKCRIATAYLPRLKIWHILPFLTKKEFTVFRLVLLSLAFVLPQLGFAQETKVPWTDKIEMFGDIRLRHDYTTKQKPIDTADSHQERLRLRFGLTGKVNDQIKTKIRIATSQGQTPLATNQTLTDNANKKGLYVDMAVVDWTPMEGQTIWAGKMENPFRVLPVSQVLYDVDYTPEGAAYQGQFGKMFVKTAGFVVQERAQQADGTSEPDSWLLAGLVGYKGDLSEKMGLTLAAGYHNFTALKKNAALVPGFAGNSAGGARYLHDYQVGEVLGELRLKGESCLISVYFDALNNFYLEKDNKAYLVGASLQTLDASGKPIWTFGYGYQSVDKDATVSALNNSDFANGNDGAFGHILQAGRSLGANTSLTLTWYNTHIDNNGTPFTSDKGLLDFVVAF